MLSTAREIASYISDNVEEVIRKATDNLVDKIRETPDKSLFENYIIEEEYISNATINIFDVIGTTHPDYIGHRWVDMLKVGKRMKTNLDLLRKNPIYYLEDKTKLPTMSYSMFNDKLYLTGDGNHRTAIAKVFFHYLGIYKFSGVNLTKYKIDTELKEKISYIRDLSIIKKVPIIINFQKTKIHREDREGYHRDIFESNIYINGINLSKEDLDILIDDLKKYNWFYKTFPFLLRSKVFKNRLEVKL